MALILVAATVLLLFVLPVIVALLVFGIEHEEVVHHRPMGL